jgi:hypothetical protein
MPDAPITSWKTVMLRAGRRTDKMQTYRCYYRCPECGIEWSTDLSNVANDDCLRCLSSDIPPLRHESITVTPGIRELAARISSALKFAEFAYVEDAEQKAYVIDRMVLALVGSRQAYDDWVSRFEDGDDGPETYQWPSGTPFQID